MIRVKLIKIKLKLITLLTYIVKINNNSLLRHGYT